MEGIHSKVEIVGRDSRCSDLEVDEIVNIVNIVHYCNTKSRNSLKIDSKNLLEIKL